MNRHNRNARFGVSLLALAAASSMCFAEQAGTATADNPIGTSAPREPVQYRVLERSLIGNEIHEAGATVSYNGLPASNLEPLCDEGRRRAAEFVESDKARVKLMIENNKEGAAGDPAEFMANLAKFQAQQIAEMQKQIAAMGENIGAAVAAGVGQALDRLFPNGIPSAPAAAPAAPATAAAPADTGSVASTDTGASEDATAPAKRTRGAAAS